jgi:hypothetical protein
MGFGGSGWAGAGWVGPTGSAQSGCIGFLFFEFIFNAKTNSRKVYKFFKGTKNTLKITKILGKFLEIDWDMNNPHKVFGVHEKDFRAF